MKLHKTALITGATGGIGEELCREFARNGYDLVITARGKEALERQALRLRRTYGVAVVIFAGDLADKDTPLRLFGQLGEVGVVVDVLVNNAGYGVGGYFAGSSLRSLEDMLQVNVLAATRFCRLFLPEMLRRRDGRILNIASVGAYVPGPMNAVYCAGKAYLLHLSEALAQECRGKGVKVSAVCPWAVGTGFADRADMESTLLFNLGVLQAKEVARAAYCAMERGQTVCTVGPAAKLTAAAVRLAPRGLSARVSGILQKPR